MWYNARMPIEATTDYQHSTGTTGRALEQMQRYLDHPDEPMVPAEIAQKMEATRNMGVAPRKLFEDDGHKINVMRFLNARIGNVTPAKTPEQIYATFERFLTFCGDNAVPPTISIWAVWNGVSLTMMNKAERDITRDPERAHALSVCKEMIRSFLELAALEGTINPILWFHANKVYFGAVETNAQVNYNVTDNTVELTEEEQRERVVQLTQGNDGVYRDSTQA